MKFKIQRLIKEKRQLKELKARLKQIKNMTQKWFQTLLSCLKVLQVADYGDLKEFNPIDHRWKHKQARYLLLGWGLMRPQNTLILVNLSPRLAFKGVKTISIESGIDLCNKVQSSSFLTPRELICKQIKHKELKWSTYLSFSATV